MARRGRAGLTLVELLVSVAIAAVLLALAVPTFGDFLARRRVEGVAGELQTDLQYARSEAVQRNAEVRVSFISPVCYVIHESSLPVGTCGVASSAALLKIVRLGGIAGISLEPSTGLTHIAFDPQRGLAAPAGDVTVNTSAGAWQLRATVSTLGRVRLCSPNASLSGYPGSCG